MWCGKLTCGLCQPTLLPSAARLLLLLAVKPFPFCFSQSLCCLVHNQALCARVFKLKLSKFKERILELWGPQVYTSHVIEVSKVVGHMIIVLQFQRGGLPHAHLVLKLPHALDNAATIDHYVQAYLPEKETHPRCVPASQSKFCTMCLYRVYAKIMKHQWHCPNHTTCKKNADGTCYY